MKASFMDISLCDDRPLLLHISTAEEDLRSLFNSEYSEPSLEVNHRDAHALLVILIALFSALRCTSIRL
jgi:hypothetical protein